MLKVLLVDDEPYMLEGLRIMVNWTSYGFTICGEASNGEDALEMIKLSNPDLVVTDIRMPVMDGLEFIRLSKERLRSSAKFVILSGYDDFTYAKRAMTYNVSDYLLKPLDSEEVEAVISKLVASIIEEKKNAENTNKQLSFIASQSIRRLIKGESKKSLFNRISLLLGINPNEAVRCILFEIEKSKQSESTDESYTNMHDEARKLIEAELGPAFHLNLFEDENERLGIFISSRMPFFETIENFASTLLKKLMGALPLSVWEAVSSQEKGPVGMATIYRQALESLKYRFFIGEGKVINYRDIQNAPLKYELGCGNINALLDKIRSFEPAEIEKNIKVLFDMFSLENLAPEAILAYLKNFELELIKMMTDLNVNPDAFSLMGVVLDKGMGHMTMEKLKDYFLQHCIYAASYLNSARQGNSQSVINEVKNYIKQNYAGDIKLKNVARIFYLNPVYLGQIFKKSTGMQFNDYLNAVRIDEAKKLLRRTDMKIIEIARTVGFNDPKYFLSKFKSITNLSPTAFKG